jgi:uncharacterized metal-binding protein YceD (DUF177 family)
VIGGTPEFSRPFQVDADMGAGDDAETFAIEATEEERAGLARRLGLIALPSLKASGTVDVSARGKRARLTAMIEAEVVQPCVVTLEPVPASIRETFTMTFDRAAPRRRANEDEDLLLDLDAEDPPDPLPEAGIDLGEAVAEHLGLALDPYPRAAGVEFRPPEEADSSGAAKTSPFSALAALKGKTPEKGKKG